MLRPLCKIATLALFALVSLSAPGRATAAPLVLERWFSGKTIGEGVVSVPIAGLERRFCVVTQGRARGGNFILVEDFVYSDGERERKTWVFTRFAGGRYVGRREDVVGDAAVWQDGEVVRLSYDIELRDKRGGLPTRLHFNDIISLDPDGLAVNTASIALFGLPIGDARVVFRKPRSARPGCIRG